jgi:hypothetical protein
MSTPDYVDYAEERDHPTREEQEGDAWEYWHQRAHKFEAALYQIHTVCADNAAPTCKHDMALNFVAQIAARALVPSKGTER